MIAQAVTDMRVLPPGRRTSPARRSASGGSRSERCGAPFTVTRRRRAVGCPTPRGVSPTVVSSQAAGAVAARTLGAVPPLRARSGARAEGPRRLSRSRGGTARCRVAGDAELLQRARTAGVSELVRVRHAAHAEVPVAAFLRGLALLAQKKLDPAANAFRSAMRGSPDFYPAMVYLGACYAAGGNDKEAAGAWRTALIREGDAVALHVLLADALLRQGNGDLALETVDGARARWPEDEGLKRRFVVAALLAGRSPRPAGARRARGEADRGRAVAGAGAAGAVRSVRGRPADRDRRAGSRADAAPRRAYRARGGPSLALVDTWVAAAATPK